MAMLKFENYFFESFSFSENEKFDYECDDLDVDFFPKVEVNILEKKSAIILMYCRLGDESKINCPFTGEVKLTGIFTAEFDESDTEDANLANELLTQNAIAILFPYLRSFVSDMTLKTNKFPSFILPPFNILNMLKEEELIQINELSNN